MIVALLDSEVMTNRCRKDWRFGCSFRLMGVSGGNRRHGVLFLSFVGFIHGLALRAFRIMAVGVFCCSQGFSLHKQRWWSSDRHGILSSHVYFFVSLSA